MAISAAQSYNDLIAKRIDIENFIEKLMTAELKIDQWSVLLDKTTENGLMAFIATNCSTSTGKMCAPDGIEVAFSNVLGTARGDSLDNDLD